MLPNDHSLFHITVIVVGISMATNMRSNTDRLMMKIFAPVRSALVFITAMMVIRFPRKLNTMIGIPTVKAATLRESEYFLGSSSKPTSVVFSDVGIEDVG